MHLVGFIIRMCHDARTPERQIRTVIVFLKKGQNFICTCNGSVASLQRIVLTS